MAKNSMGALVARKREAMGISQRALSERIGAAETYIYQIENGRGPVRVIEKLRTLAAVMGVTLDELVSGREGRT